MKKIKKIDLAVRIAAIEEYLGLVAADQTISIVDETMINELFDELPDYYSFIAMDENGDLNAFVEKPKISLVQGKFMPPPESSYIASFISGGHCAKNWRNSLKEKGADRQISTDFFDGVSDNFNFIAYDEDGEKWAFEKRPVITDSEFNDGYWNHVGGRFELIGRHINTHYPEWKESLVEREPVKKAAEISAKQKIINRLENGEQYILCAVSNESERFAKAEPRLICLVNHYDELTGEFETSGLNTIRFSYAVEVDSFGELI